VRPPEPFVAEPATPEDAADVASLMSAFDRAHLDEPDVMDASEVAGWWRRVELASDSLLVRDPRGRLAAAGTLKEEGADVLDLDAFVHPELAGRGLGGFLLDWAEQEADRRRRPVLRTAALAADAAAPPLVTKRGFEPVRHFYRMLVDLEEPPSEPLWPAGFEPATFAPGDEAVLHAVLEEAFADHWGHEPESLDDWQQRVFGREWWDPTLVHLVRAGDEVVAAEINAVRFGVGWIGTLGTRKPLARPRARAGAAAGRVRRTVPPRREADRPRRGRRQRDRRHAPLRERRDARGLAGRRLREAVPLPVTLSSFWVASTKRCKDAGSLNRRPIGATEDAAARRVIAGQKPEGVAGRGTV
jgi:GNAT superfamily N-acetyltransferase